VNYAVFEKVVSVNSLKLGNMMNVEIAGKEICISNSFLNPSLSSFAVPIKDFCLDDYKDGRSVK